MILVAYYSQYYMYILEKLTFQKYVQFSMLVVFASLKRSNGLSRVVALIE